MGAAFENRARNRTGDHYPAWKVAASGSRLCERAPARVCHANRRAM